MHVVYGRYSSLKTDFQSRKVLLWEHPFDHLVILYIIREKWNFQDYAIIVSPSLNNYFSSLKIKIP